MMKAVAAVMMLPLLPLPLLLPLPPIAALLVFGAAPAALVEGWTSPATAVGGVGAGRRPSTTTTTAPAAAAASPRSSLVSPRQQQSPSSSSTGASSAPAASISDATELPDSLEDAAVRAAEATCRLLEASGTPAATRCRVDFDTSIGDETYTLLKSTEEFMQNYVASLVYAAIPDAQQLRQEQIAQVAQARAELEELTREKSDGDDEDDEDEDDDGGGASETEARIEELKEVVASGGGKAASDGWSELPSARIYFPDEGSAALARRDWTASSRVPPNVQFSACGGIRQHSAAGDCLVFFYCPKASESEAVEKLLRDHETADGTQLRASVFVNPNLVDMGVTGFGLAGRMLRERLIDPLQYAYYLRTLPWGALTRKWPSAFSVWQEDADAEGGYRLIKTMDRLPSNPEVEDIYDAVNGKGGGDGEGGGPGVLDQLGDFVNGMMRL